MIIDRAAFLALTATLAVGCAASSGEENTAGDEAAISAGGGDLCYSADESTKPSAVQYWSGTIGFDPVNDFPAAESFCFDLASTGVIDAEDTPIFDMGIYTKCSAYAKVYVPHVAYEAYSHLTTHGNDLRHTNNSRAKWDVLYALDEKIAAEDFFCQTSTDRILCRNAKDQGACLRASTQMNEDAKEKLASCIEKWDVYTCVEGTDGLRPYGVE